MDVRFEVEEIFASQDPHEREEELCRRVEEYLRLTAQEAMWEADE